MLLALLGQLLELLLEPVQVVAELEHAHTALVGLRVGPSLLLSAEGRAVGESERSTRGVGLEELGGVQVVARTVVLRNAGVIEGDHVGLLMLIIILFSRT